VIRARSSVGKLPAALLAIVLVGGLGAVVGSAAAWAVECVEETDALRDMERVSVVFETGDGEMLALDARLAATGSQRSAGFQHVCPGTIERERILFDFHASIPVAFHMRNVHAPLDIAFFAGDGSLVSLFRMETYEGDRSDGPLYRPEANVRFALETAADQLDELGLSHPATRVVRVESLPVE